jgi:hypothetical protein
MYRILATILLLVVLIVCWIAFGPESASAPTSSGSSNELRNFRIP